MNTLIRTITNTVMRAAIYKGMRGQGKYVTIALAVGAGLITVVTQK